MGPGLICTTWPRTSNSPHFSTSTLASSRSSSSRTACGPPPALSSVLGGSLNPLTFLGATVAVRSSASARSWMAMLLGCGPWCDRGGVGAGAGTGARGGLPHLDHAACGAWSAVADTGAGVGQRVAVLRRSQ